MLCGPGNASPNPVPVRRRQFPFKNPRTGAWTVQFDQEQAYNAKALVFTRLRIVVTRKPGSRS